MSSSRSISIAVRWKSDGSTFPPVTPDPPPPPGYVDPLEGTGVTEAAAPDGDDGESSGAH